MKAKEWHSFTQAASAAFERGFHAVGFWTDAGMKVEAVNAEDKDLPGYDRRVRFGYYTEMPNRFDINKDIKTALIGRYRVECYAVRLYRVSEDNMKWVREQCLEFGIDEDYLNRIYTKVL